MFNGEGQGKERKAPPKFQEIDAAIKRRGSVKKFVKEVGIHEQTYYAIQSGRTTPTLGTIFAVLKYTGLDFDTAFGNYKKGETHGQQKHSRNVSRSDS